MFQDTRVAHTFINMYICVCAGVYDLERFRIRVRHKLYSADKKGLSSSEVRNVHGHRSSLIPAASRGSILYNIIPSQYTMNIIVIRVL